MTDANADAVANDKNSHRGSVPFASARSADHTVEVSLVMVPPSGAGVAYGHHGDGRCVSIRGQYHDMLELFRRLREQGRAAKPAKVYLDDAKNFDIATIARPECPTHMLPEAPEGSIVAWAPY